MPQVAHTRRRQHMDDEIEGCRFVVHPVFYWCHSETLKLVVEATKSKVSETRWLRPCLQLRGFSEPGGLEWKPTRQTSPRVQSTTKFATMKLIIQKKPRKSSSHVFLHRRHPSALEQSPESQLLIGPQRMNSKRKLTRTLSDPSLTLSDPSLTSYANTTSNAAHASHAEVLHVGNKSASRSCSPSLSSCDEAQQEEAIPFPGIRFHHLDKGIDVPEPSMPPVPTQPLNFAK